MWKKFQQSCNNLAAIFLCNNLGTIFLEVLGQWPIMTSSKPKIKKLHTYSSVFTRFNNLARLLTILQQSCWMQDCCKNVCGLVISYQYPVGIGICYIIVSFIGTIDSLLVLQIILCIIIKFFGTLAIKILFTMTSELFPTPVRSTTMGIGIF